MDFRRKAEEEEEDDEDVSYTPPTIREPVFSKPLLPSSSSLIPVRGGAAVGGVPNGIMSDPFSGSVRRNTIRYRECLRNHAASLGGHVLDGCGEFMPSSPDAMKCAACCCHRSFHRRHQNGENHSGEGGRIPLLLPPPPAVQNKQIHSGGMVALGSNSGGATTTESSSEELGIHKQFMMPSSKKRFRTKFSSAQKVKMMDFAERIGWRIQRQDDAEMERFCAEIGVSRQVFKVWMHNNKHFIRRQPNHHI